MKVHGQPYLWPPFRNTHADSINSNRIHCVRPALTGLVPPPFCNGSPHHISRLRVVQIKRGPMGFHYLKHCQTMTYAHQNRENYTIGVFMKY